MSDQMRRNVGGQWYAYPPIDAIGEQSWQENRRKKARARKRKTIAIGVLICLVAAALVWVAVWATQRQKEQCEDRGGRWIEMTTITTDGHVGVTHGCVGR